MADEQFYTILTNIGKAKVANAALLSSNVTLKMLKVGDGNGAYYNPTEDQKELRNVVYTCNVGSVSVDKDNPNWIVAETIIPGSVGGFTIREVGLFDIDGDLIAVGKYPETYKPVVANGASKDLNVRTIFEVSNAESVTLNLDPSVIIATKEDIENLQKQITSNDEDIAVLSNPNLLINGDFENPVNQREITSIDSDTLIQNNCYNYFIDRWFYQYLGLKANIVVDNDGILITATGDNGCDNPHIAIGQPLDIPYKVFANKKVTVSFEIETNSRVRLIFAGHDKSFTRIIDDKYFYGTESNILKERIYISGTAISEFSDSCPRVTIALYDGGYLRVKNAKLELGDKATPFVPRLYEEELQLCKRYYEVSSGDVIMPGMKGSTGKYEAEYRFDVEKRITPTLIYANGNESKKFALFTLNIAGNLQEVASSTIETKKVRFMINSSDSNANGIPCTMTGYIKADAEIY